MAGPYSRYWMNFVRNWQSIFQSGSVILDSYQQSMRLSVPLWRSVWSVFLNFSLSNRCVVKFHCRFNLQFPNNEWYSAGFMGCVPSIYLPWWHICSYLFTHFFLLACFPTANIWKFWILDLRPLSDTCFAKVFLLLYGLSFHSRYCLLKRSF